MTQGRSKYARYQNINKLTENSLPVKWGKGKGYVI